MKIILKKSELIKIANKEKKLGFVPTMGSIHKGHISIMKKAIKESDKIVVSIFINKPQFNNDNDYRDYPRKINNDIFLLKKLKVDYLYMPSYKQIYPKGTNRNIQINPFAKKLCGKFRPGHFEAVVDVIDRFIKIIKPKKVYMGKKDMQQLKIVEDYVSKNYKDIKVVGCKTIREYYGVAYSSRNLLLSVKEKIIAAKIFKYIYSRKKTIVENKISVNKIKKRMLEFGVSKIDYVKVLNINKITKPYKKNNAFRIFIAYYLGAVRLIDNI